MITIQLTVPDDLEREINERVETGQWSSHGDYILNILRERLATEQIEAVLRERVKEPCVDVTDADFDAIRARFNLKSSLR